MLARFVDVELVFTPVSELSASDRGARDSRERRRSVLTEGDGSCSDGVNDEPCCATATSQFGLASVSLTMGSSALSSATDDADDCERRVPVPVLAAEPEVVVIVEETELDGAGRAMRLASGEPGVGLAVAAASARTPPAKLLSTVSPLGITCGGAIGGVDEDVGEKLRPKSRWTIRSHFRLRSTSSDSCAASWERSSRHFDSFWAMNWRRSACLGRSRW